jgi:hypothetical protein
MLAGFELRTGYAFYQPEGATNVAGFLQLLEQAMAACRESGATRLLVDARALRHPFLGTHQLFELGSGLAAFWDRDIRLAMVGRSDQIDPERFGRLVAENRGLRYSAHTTEADALRALLV